VAVFRTGAAPAPERRAVEDRTSRAAQDQSKKVPSPVVAPAKILFLGNSYNPLSVACLRALVDSGYETTVGAYDPLGEGALRLFRRSLKNRGWTGILGKTGQLIRSTAKFVARRCGLPLEGFASLPELIHARELKTIPCADPNSREFIQNARQLNVDLIVVAAFSRILKNALLEVPRVACINVHPSLLPRYRGPEPFYWVLANSEKKTGVTVHHMSEQIDAGDIILQRDFDIQPNDDVSALTERCSELGAVSLCDAVQALMTGTSQRVPQVSTDGSYYSFPPRGVSVRTSRARVRASRSVGALRQVSPVYSADPLRDPRWSAFLDRHPRASVFHSIPWLQALNRTYQFEPVVFTTTPPGEELRNGVVFCRVKSWITGRRLVSLPFSDHCEPLVDSSNELDVIRGHLQTVQESGGWKYVEVRPAIRAFDDTSTEERFQPSKRYYLHTIDLGPKIEDVTRRFHKSSIQLSIRRAERRGLRHECGRSDFLFEKFWEMLLHSRRRHCVPPPPAGWFRNLRDCLGNALKIHVAFKDKTPVASVLTLKFKNTVVYKYGGSDQAYHRLGSMPFVLFNSICEAKSNGAQVFDLGRSDCENTGLIRFKNRWASIPTLITYWRFPGPAPQTSNAESRSLKLAKRVFQSVPDSVLKLAGETLYRHVG